jgi:ectoine hydroxylase-related dioxygenase (phytanoyl-CoA dioxygenase family)
MLPVALYADTTKFNTGWHQDHESYYYFQQNYHYLNFYIILEKEDPNKSGLSIIPFDKLREYSGADKIIGSGAKSFHPQENSTTVISQETGEIFNIPVDIDSIALTPNLEPGDLFLLRGDTIHKTQDNETHRLALSIRCTRGDSVIKLGPLDNPCPAKQKYINNNLQPYLNLKAKLMLTGHITAEEAIGDNLIARIT